VCRPGVCVGAAPALATPTKLPGGILPRGAHALRGAHAPRSAYMPRGAHAWL